MGLIDRFFGKKKNENDSEIKDSNIGLEPEDSVETSEDSSATPVVSEPSSLVSASSEADSSPYPVPDEIPTHSHSISDADQLSDVLDDICASDADWHHGILANHYIFIEKHGDVFNFSYFSYHFRSPAFDSFCCTVRDFLLYNTRARICDHFFPKAEPEPVVHEPYEMPEKYDPRQQEVICLDDGCHLVLAPAGCGKTDILAERVRRAIYSGTPVRNMICLTFTNRASRGMRQRVSSIIGDLAEDLFIGNTHRFCSKFLFQNNILNQSCSIADEDDSLSIINSFTPYIIRNENEEDEEEDEILDKIDKVDVASLKFDQKAKFSAVMKIQHLMKQYRSGHPKSILLHSVSHYKDYKTREYFYKPEMFKLLCLEAGLPVSQESILSIYDNVESHLNSDNFSDNSRNLLELMDVARKYEDYKSKAGVVDFEDLLIMTYDYAVANPDTIPRFSWIQIDEVQDLNPLQFAIVDAFSAPDNVTVYLGDEQQAIFSFIGASLKTMQWLKSRCRNNLHHLSKCYRSPKYLLDVFNHYASYILDTDPDFLPRPNNLDAPSEDDLILYDAGDSMSAFYQCADLARSFPDGRTAVIVTKNYEADYISNALGDVPHLKISGTDLFSLVQSKLLISHLNVLNFDSDSLSWARILAVLKILPSYSQARKFVSALKESAVSPSDFLLYEDSSYVLEFLKCFHSGNVVVFDTETTGLDVFSDDIVQIAATKYVDGNPVDSIDIILHTDKDIPPMLGKDVNPLVAAYASRPHLDRSEGLRRFADFARGSVLVGHNVNYDYNILVNNCLRDLPSLDVYSEFPLFFDTLKLARMLYPGLKSFKLKDLIVALRLQGQNSHLANDDIVATHSLAECCFQKASELESDILEILATNRELGADFRNKYASLYLDAVRRLYVRKYDGEPALVDELRRAYSHFKSLRAIRSFKKFELICSFLEKDVINSEADPSLVEQLGRHIMDINTFKEADVCDSSVVTENIFIATVHKAKGLEFENVIVYGCVDEIYPSFFARSEPEDYREEARKLYVAISRAKKRLCLVTFDTYYVNPPMFDLSFPKRTDVSRFLRQTIKLHDFSNRDWTWLDSNNIV